MPNGNGTNPTVQQIVMDPTFAQLSPSDQHAVLANFDSDFGQLSSNELPGVIATLQKSALARPDLASPTRYAAAPAAPAAPQDYGRAMVPVMGEPRVLFTDVPRGQEQAVGQAAQAGYQQGAKAGLTGLTAAALPELLPAAPGVLGYVSSVLGRAGLAGFGAAAGTSAGQVLSGENPLAPEKLKQSITTGGATGALSVPFEMLGQLPFTKSGRGAVNLSLGAQARDVTYGNPAKALTNEGIGNVLTGDFEAYKDGLRQGLDQSDAAQAAGGRFAAVNQRIQQLVPRLSGALQRSQAQIPIADAIDQPLNDAAIDIIHNPAMTLAEKDAALSQLGGLQQSVHQALPPGATTASPSQLQAIKQAVGDRVNWGGATAVADEVKPAYRALYGSLKSAIHDAVPPAAALDERLTNLLAAQNDLLQLSKLEEVGRGMGISRGKIGSSLVGAAQSAAGRFLPSATAATSPVPKGVIGSMVSAVSQRQPEEQ